MIDKIKEYIVEVENFKSDSTEEIEKFRIKFLGKKGILNGFFAEFKMSLTSRRKLLAKR